MDKSEVYPLVFISLFIVFYSVLASSALSMVAIDYDIDDAILPNYTPNINNTAYEVYDGVNSTNDGELYYNVTMPGDYEYWKIDVSGYNDVLIFVYNTDDNDDDFLQFSKRDEGAWFAWDNTVVSLTKTELLEIIDDYPITQTTIKIELQKIFEISLVSYPGDTLYDGILNEKFTMIFGENKRNVSHEEQGAFDSFVQLVTFNIPEMDEGVKFLIATPIYVLGTYLVVRVVLMFLPFVSGGA